MSAPLRIGMLGASRIAELAILEATAGTGDVRAAVAARDPERARAYAVEHGFERAHASYEALIADDSLDLVYIGLPNGLHAEWTARALEAGRNVLVEKPFAANRAEFDAVARRLGGARGWAWEAFHYADHPAVQRLVELVRDGAVGAPREIDVHMDMPDPGAADPRWSYDLAGGALMDVGCYALNVLLLLGEALGETPVLLEAEAEPSEGDPRVDAAVRARLALGGATAAVHTSMASPGWDFGLRVTGSDGEILLTNFVKPQEGGRLIVRTDSAAGSETREEVVDPVSSYIHQLRRLRTAVREGEAGVQGPGGAGSGVPPRDPDAERSELLERSRRTMALIDEVYAACGLPPRPGRL